MKYVFGNDLWNSIPDRCSYFSLRHSILTDSGAHQASNPKTLGPSNYA
jgi:hypothetical protein